MLGEHIDTNDDASSEVYIGRLLQVALAGGVFRWLQIGCGTSFEQRVQVRQQVKWLSVSCLALSCFFSKVFGMPPHACVICDAMLYGIDKMYANEGSGFANVLHGHSANDSQQPPRIDYLSATTIFILELPDL